MGRVAVLAVYLILGSAILWAVVPRPDYSVEKLSDPAFVKAEIGRYGGYREDTQSQLAKANPILRSALSEDVRRCEMVLEALRYIESHGFRADDPELLKLTFFERVLVTGMKQKPTAGKSRKGRVFQLDNGGSRNIGSGDCTPGLRPGGNSGQRPDW